MIDRHVDGKKLREIRERLGLKRGELAEKSGVSLSWIKYIELENRQPSGIKGYALADALDVDISAFTREVRQEAA